MPKLLTYTTLYPNAVKRRHGIFVETRLRHLVASGQVEARVVAPVPWFPFTGKRWGQYGEYARVPAEEECFGIPVSHPRYPLIPKMGLSTAPFFLAAATLPHLKSILNAGYDFDIIDSHFFYPDGVAATLLAKWLGKKVTVTARGTDIHTYPQFFFPRLLIRQALFRADHLVAVCKALADELMLLGAPEKKVTTLRNGVDLEFFQPSDKRNELRDKLGLKGRVLLSVGNLIGLKGHDLIIQALARLPQGYKLWIIGDGEEEASLKKLVDRSGVQGRVFFVRGMPQDKLKEFYQASDALVLASDREGWANVLLEAMACGTPVAATNIWGTPEVVCHPDAGMLIEQRTPASIAETILRLFAAYPSRTATRNFAQQFDWEGTTKGQLEIFRSLLSRA